jgi:type IV pilus assembly protein PilQ
LKRTASKFLFILTFVLLISVVALSDEFVTHKVTAVFYNTDLIEALNEISLQTGITILTDQYVSGLVTAEFYDVELEYVLDVLLLPGGYSYKKVEDNVYFVGLADPKSHNFLNLAEVKIFPLKYITTEKFLTLVPDSLQQYIKINKETNELVVYAPKDKISYIEDLVLQLDKNEPYIELTIYIVETNDSSSETIKGNVFKINQDGLKNNFYYSYPNIGFSIQDLFEAEIEMYAKAETANLITKQTVKVLPGEKATLYLKSIDTILFVSSYRTEFRTLEEGVEIEMTPKYLNETLQITFKTKSSNIMDIKRDSYIISESRLETKVNLFPTEVLLVADLDMSQLYSKKGGTSFLKDLPILRFLFGDDVKRDENKRLLIFLTSSLFNQGVGGE